MLEECVGTIQAKVADGIVPGIPVPDVRLSTLGLYESAVGAASLAHHHTFDVVDSDFALSPGGVRPTFAAQ